MVRIHGNWCGPGWTAGQYKDAKDLTDADRQVPATSALDAACKAHDIGLHDAPFAAAELNARFTDEIQHLGLGAQLAGAVVERFGPTPTPLSKKTPSTDMPRVRTGFARGSIEKLRQEAASLENENNNQQLKRRSESIGDNSGPLHKVRAIEVDHSGDIIPFDSNHTSGMDTNMDRDDGDDGGERQALTASGPGGGNAQSKETQISSYPSLSYGFQETHTTIIPWTAWISVCGLSELTPVQVAIRMNSIYDILSNNSLQTPPSSGAAYTAKGIYATPVDNQDPMKRPTFNDFPAVYSGSANEIPNWAKTWNSLYQW